MADYNYITGTGTVIPDTSQVKTDVENEYKAIYGADFVVDSSSEQGREIDAEITSRISVLRNNAKLANQINPNQADGLFLDSVYALTGGERDKQEQSTVQCVIAGVANTIIAEGSRVKDDNGENWLLADAVIIPINGSIETSFISENYGAIPADIGEITQIIDDVIGWETVINNAPATIGKLDQSDVSTRRQRKLELGLNARSNSLAIIAKISELDGVGSMSFRENVSDSTQIIDNVEMISHSTYVCVDGGADQEIAEAYYIAKSGGSAFNGDVEIIITDEYSNQLIPVKFSRPIDKAKLIRVTVRVSSGADSASAIRQAVVDYANGLIDGEDGFVVGGDVSPFEIGAAVNAEVSGVFVAKCEVAENSGSPYYTTDTIHTEIFEKASTTESLITVLYV